MGECETIYRVVLRRDDASEFVRRNLQPIKQVFAAMDRLAFLVRDEDEQLMEVVNSVADLLRGVLSARHGVDISPDSDLGPDEPIDVAHAIRVLARIVRDSSSLDGSSLDSSSLDSSSLDSSSLDSSSLDSSSIDYTPRTTSDEDRDDLVRRVALIERGILEFEACLEAQGTAADGQKLANIKRCVANLKTSRLLTADDARSPGSPNSSRA